MLSRAIQNVQNVHSMTGYYKNITVSSCSHPTGRGPGSYKHNKLKRPVNHAALAMDSDARHDFAAADAPHSPRKDRRLVIPDPKSLPESEEESDGGEEESPSQYKLSRMREESSHISDGSNGGSSDEEVEIAEEEMLSNAFVKF